MLPAKLIHILLAIIAAAVVMWRPGIPLIYLKTTIKIQ